MTRVSAEHKARNRRAAVGICRNLANGESFAGACRLMGLTVPEGRSVCLSARDGGLDISGEIAERYAERVRRAVRNGKPIPPRPNCASVNRLTVEVVLYRRGLPYSLARLTAYQRIRARRIRAARAELTGNGTGTA